MTADRPACCAPPRDGASLPARPARTPTPARGGSLRGVVDVPAGRFAMGDAFDEGYAADGERPVHEVELPAYRIGETAVTNAQFATFAKSTGHVTDAEEFGASAVFHLAFAGDRADVLGAAAGTPWWLTVRGADWRHPEGPGSDVSRRPQHPVVQVSHRDAEAYAAWVGGRLPTEAEWERAARGGLAGARFPWGDELMPDGRFRCNIWQGSFPTVNTAEDGFVTTAPVKTYVPNGLGLWQTSGNVWEWCADWFDPQWYDRSPTVAPTGPEQGTHRVMRGGSHLCHDSYCHRYRVAARSANTPESTASNVGFRVAG